MEERQLLASHHGSHSMIGVPSVTVMGAMCFTRFNWPAHRGSIHVDSPVQTVDFSSDLAHKIS